MKYYVVDAFTDKLFAGNPAGVCILDKKIPDALMQRIAQENNLSETAFLLKEKDEYSLRWFTPEVEFDLCGHATMATAYVALCELGLESDEIVFHTMSGILKVRKENDKLYMDFPKRMPKKIDITDDLVETSNQKVLRAYQSRDLILELENEEAVRNFIPDYEKLQQINSNPEFGVIVTAKGDQYDFVSRYFSPNSVILEDPVTGSAHCSLIPFWSDRLKKDEMEAFQLSKRGGKILCLNQKERVRIGGNAVCYLRGELVDL